MKPRVAVLYGGVSAEHEISVRSAKTIVAHFPKTFQPVPVFLSRSGSWKIQKRINGIGTEAVLTTRRGRSLIRGQKFAAVFPVLHGPMGEDGTVQGLLELAGVPYVGCGVLASSAGMDKRVTKILAEKAGLPQLPYAAFDPASCPKSVAAARKAFGRWGLPLFVKPVRMGSSVGVSKVKRWTDFPGAVKTAFRFDTDIIVEKGVDAREIECAVLGDDREVAASLPGEILLRSEFYDYESKYLSDTDSEQKVPADLPKATARRIQDLSVKAFIAIQGFGPARVDFLLDRKTGKPWFNELNTMPGFTSISMYPMMWEASGLPLERLIEKLIRSAIRRGKRQARLEVKR